MIWIEKKGHSVKLWEHFIPSIHCERLLGVTSKICCRNDRYAVEMGLANDDEPGKRKTIFDIQLIFQTLKSYMVFVIPR